MAARKKSALELSLEVSGMSSLPVCDAPKPSMEEPRLHTANPFGALDLPDAEPHVIDLHPGHSFSASAAIASNTAALQGTAKPGPQKGLLGFGAVSSSISDLFTALDEPKRSASTLDLSSMMKPITETLIPEPTLNPLMKSILEGHSTDPGVQIQSGKNGKAQSKRVSKRKQRAAERAAGYAGRSESKATQAMGRKSRILKQKKRR